MVIQLIGQASAIIALAVGIFLSIYALRYYVSILRVLVGGTAWSGDQFGNEWRIGNSSNSFSSLQLKREPFVSIHIPVYNESRVIERIVKRCASLNYKNYEVIIVDDSSDETVETLYKNCTGVPNVKIIHRANRAGFKGGALNEALRHTDPRAEYICVFDADFVPPPDIIQRFLWYFENPNYMNNSKNRNDKADRRSAIIEMVADWRRRLETAVVQGYQWHVLNADENWLTKGVKAGFSGGYMVEKMFLEASRGMNMIAGSVFMIKADVLRAYKWSTSITEDWELTLRLYLDGYKVVYSPLIYAPAECPSTLKQLIRQRMRWAEGHTYNVKKYFWKVLRSKNLTRREKLDFLTHYAFYYLQAFFQMVGTICWLVAESLHTYPPFWTAAHGWFLVAFNLFALPLMSLTGAFLERRTMRDLPGVLSSIVISHLLIPFQAFAALKGLLERREGVWFRTPKTGRVTERLLRLEVRKILRKVLPLWWRIRGQP